MKRGKKEESLQFSSPAVEFMGPPQLEARGAPAVEGLFVANGGRCR
jgi:hypothetical protein